MDPAEPGRGAPDPAPGRDHQMVSPGGTIFWLSCGSGPVPAVLSGADSGGGVGRVTPPGGDPAAAGDGWAAAAGEGDGADE